MKKQWNNECNEHEVNSAIHISTHELFHFFRTAGRRILQAKLTPVSIAESFQLQPTRWPRSTVYSV